LGLLRDWSEVPLTALRVPTSTSSAYLRGENFPTWKFVHTLVTKCLTKVGLDPACELPHWEKAWSYVRRQVKERRKKIPKLAQPGQSTRTQEEAEHQEPGASMLDRASNDGDLTVPNVSAHAASAQCLNTRLGGQTIDAMRVAVSWLAIGPVGRFFTGAPVFGDIKSTATFTRPAAERWTERNSPWWNIRGWLRVAIRLVAVVSAAWIITVTLLPYPWILIAGCVVVVLAIGYVRRWLRYRRYTTALFDRLRLIFHLSANEKTRDWVTIPRNVDVVRDRSQSVRLRIPSGWHPAPALHVPEYDDTGDGDPQTRPWAQLLRVVDRHLPGEWDRASLSGSQQDRVLLCHRSNAAPQTYYDPAGFSSTEIPLGSTGGGPFTANLDTDCPHMLFAGPLRWAQRMAMMPISHIAHHGGLVDICTPNRVLPQAYHAVDSVRVHTGEFSIERGAAQFVVSLIDAYQRNASDYADDAATRTRLLVLDNNFNQLYKVLHVVREEQSKDITLTDVIDLLVNGHTRRHFLMITTPYPHMKDLMPFIGKFGTIVAAGYHGPRAWLTMFGHQIQPAGFYPPGYAVAGNKHRIFDIRPCLITPSIARATAHTSFSQIPPPQ
jgi:hypothetical protein